MRFIFKLVVFVFLFQDYTAFCQNHKILYRILNDTLIIDPRSPIVELEFELINKSDTDYILYGFSNIEPLFISLESIKNNNCVVRNGIYITQNKMIRNSKIIFYEDFTPYESLLKSNMIILRGHSKISFVEEITLEYFELEPWEYKLSLVYYSGKNISTYFTEEEISAEEKKYGATFFRGWVQSNSVPLIVRYGR